MNNVHTINIKNTLVKIIDIQVKQSALEFYNEIRFPHSITKEQFAKQFRVAFYIYSNFSIWDTLYTDKTELIWCETLKRLQQLQNTWLQTTSIRVRSEIIPPSSSACDLNFYIDANLLITFYLRSRCLR